MRAATFGQNVYPILEGCVAADALRFGAFATFVRRRDFAAGQCAGSGRGVYADSAGRLALSVLAAGRRPVPYVDGGAADRFA